MNELTNEEIHQLVQEILTGSAGVLLVARLIDLEGGIKARGMSRTNKFPNHLRSKFIRKAFGLNWLDCLLMLLF